MSEKERSRSSDRRRLVVFWNLDFEEVAAGEMVDMVSLVGMWGGEELWVCW